MKDEKVPLKTILQNFINHVENLEARLKENNDLYESEFQELKNISDSLKSQKYYACSEGEKPVNRKKNRYKDILPFDVSRVVLSEFPGVVGSDYINANYIRGASGSPAYIASQGPLPHTVADFWRMAVECEVQVIVMACNQTEAGKHKCEHYVPEQDGTEQTFGDVGVTLSQSRQVCPDFTVKKLSVRYTGASGSREERLVCQFHYSAWPDHGVPSSVMPLLHMIRMLRDTQASETLPVLVHCSAGCGRTGTVCAIDYVWGLLKAGKLTPNFSLFDLVAEMRRQRIAMVQTKDQYMLVHRAVRQLFTDQLRVIESHPYANVDSAGKVLVAGAGRTRAADDGDYEEICLLDDVSPPAQKRSAPSPPPQIKPPPRRNAPRHRSRPPPLPHKRRAPQPEEALAGGGGGDGGDVSLERQLPQSDGAEPQYQGSLDRAETGRRASVGRLRQVFESSESAPPAAHRLSRSKSSAALRCRPPGPPAGRPRTGSVSEPRDRQLALYAPPAGPPRSRAPRPPEPPTYAELADARPAPAKVKSPPPPPPPTRTSNRAKSPPQVRPVSRARSPMQMRPFPRGMSPTQVRPVSRAKSPPQVRPVSRAKSPPQVRPVPRAKSPPQVRPVPRAKSPPQVCPVPRAKSPSQVRPVSRTRTSPLCGVTVNNVSAAQPVVRIVSVAGPPAGRLLPVPDRRPVLPIKRSKSLKIPAASALRVQRLGQGPAYLALENAPSRVGPSGAARPAATSERRSPPPVVIAPPPAAQPAAVGRYINASAASSGLATPPDDSPPRYVNIDLLRQYEEELVQRSRELGLNDTLPDEPAAAATAGLLSPALVTSAVGSTGGGGGGGAVASHEPHYANVPSPSPPPSLSPAARRVPPAPAPRLAPTEEPPPPTNYRNCTPQARQNLRRIETELERNQRSGFYDASEARPAPSSLGWLPRERRNSFRQAVEGGEPGRVGNYEPIWVGDERRSPAAAAPAAPLQHCSSLPPDVERRVAGPLLTPRPFVSPRSAAATAAAPAPVAAPVAAPAPAPASAAAPAAPRPAPAAPRPAVVPVSSYIVQGDVGDSAGSSPMLVGNSLFWSDGPGRRDTAAAAQKVTANSVFYARTPSPPGRTSSLNVSENSAFKPYLPDKAASQNYAAIYRQPNGCSPPLSSGGGGGETHPSRSDGSRSAESAERGPVAPPRKRTSTGLLPSRLSVSQPQLVGPSHLFLADIELDGVGAAGSGAERDSDTDSLPPAVPEKTQAAYQVPTLLRDALPTVRPRPGSDGLAGTGSPPTARPRPGSDGLAGPGSPPVQRLRPGPDGLAGPGSPPVQRLRSGSPSPTTQTHGGAPLSRSLSLRPGGRLEAAEPRPFNKALGLLQATASNLRSRLSSRAEPPPPSESPPPPPPPHDRRRPAGVNAHSRQAYI